MPEHRWIKALLLINTVFLGYLLFFGERSPSSGGDITVATRLFDEQLSKGNHQAAYDLLLTATRISPSDTRLIDLIERFVASARLNPANEDLAEEIVVRSQALVHFQRPAEVVNMRSRLDRLMRSPHSPEAPTKDDAPFAEKLLAVVRSKDLPMEVRFEALEQARSDLDSAIFDAAVQGENGPDQGLETSQREIKDRITEAERVLLGDVLHELKNASKALGTEYTSIATSRKPEPLTADTYADLDKQLTKLERKGMALLQQAGQLGYLLEEENASERGDVLPAFQETTDELDKQVARTQMQRVFYYNQYVMQQLEAIQSGDKDAVDNLVSLLLHEDWFMDFVAQKYNEKWKAAVEKLSESEILEATSKRVLQTLKTRR